MTNEFNLEFLISSIEELCKQRKMSVKSALEDCGLTRNVVDNMKKGSVPSIDKIFTLSNYFDVSVDYLLGRTDEPNSTLIKSGDINGDNNSLTDSNNVNISKKQTDSISEKFMEIFNNLPFEEQLTVMNFAVEKSKNERK